VAAEPSERTTVAAEPIVRVAAALELLHTMALIHDDLIDAATERRGVPTTAPQLAGEALGRGFAADAARFGSAGAVLAGDLAAVLADRLMLTSGFEPGALVRGLGPYHEMRLDMAAGELLDVAGLASHGDVAVRAARLKGGSYTVEGPLLVGAALVGGDARVQRALRSYGRPLGEAFQLRDDLHDRDGAHGATPATVNDLVGRARAALRDAPIEPEAASALDELAALVTMP
jgi:geranylgeranyl diphosphate synthase type I